MVQPNHYQVLYFKLCMWLFKCGVYNLVVACGFDSLLLLFSFIDCCCSFLLHQNKIEFGELSLVGFLQMVIISISDVVLKFLKLK